MKKLFTTKRLCRAGIIAALYAALSYAFLPVAFGPFQIRPSEGLCLLPLLFPEAIPALFVGCALSNLPSPYFAYDILFGSLTTLLSAILTYFIGKTIKKEWVKIAVGGFFPVFLNAVVLPLIIVFLYGNDGGYASVAVAYFTFFGSILLTESVCVYAVGVPLYVAVKKLSVKK